MDDCEGMISKDTAYLVSTSLFRLQGGEYKSFKKYTNGLQTLCKIITTKLPGFSLRIYVDDTILKDHEIHNHLKRLRPPAEIVRYSCPRFKDTGNFHKGLFGTLIRYAPLFDAKSSSKVVLIADADATPEWRSIRIYRDLKAHPGLHNRLMQSYIFLGGRLFHDVVMTGKLSRCLNCDGKIIPYCIAPGLIGGGRRIDSNILKSFLRAADTTEERWSNYARHHSKFTKGFVFGIDEYFLNEVLVPYVIDNKFSFGVSYTFSFVHSLFFFVEHNNKNILDSNQYLKKFFAYVTKSKDVTVKEGLALVERLYQLQSNLSPGPDAKYIYRIYRFFVELLRRPHDTQYDEIFHPWFLRMILDKTHLPYYSGKIYRFYNPSLDTFTEAYSWPTEYQNRLLEKLNKKLA